MQGNKMHLEQALAGEYFVSDYHECLSCLNMLPLTSGMKWKTYFYFKCCSGYYSLLIDDYVKPTYKGTLPTRHSSHQDLLIP